MAENKEGFTPKQIDDARKARELYHIVGAPNIEKFKIMLRMNQIRNCPITTQDVDRAATIYGADVSTLKGKSTRRQPPKVVTDIVEIPPELIGRNHKIELCIDGMFVNGRGFMTSIDKSVRYRSAVRIESTSAKSLYEAIDKILRVYNSAGFIVVAIHADPEYTPIFDAVKDDLDVTMCYTAAQDHVPEAERNNCTIKERVRVGYHRLPYRKLPNAMVDALVFDSTRKLNFFPAKGGVSPYFSPEVLIHNTVVDYRQHCSTPFGSYVQALHEINPTNATKPRTIGCVFLRPNFGDHLSYELLNLKTGKKITRRKVTVIPITDEVVKKVRMLAKRDGMKPDLVFRKRKGDLVFDDAALIAGVEENTQDANAEDYFNL